MTNDDLRRALLLQRRLFGSQTALADAMGVSPQALSQFLKRRNAIPRDDSQILKAMGLHVEVERVLKPDEKL